MYGPCQYVTFTFTSRGDYKIVQSDQNVAYTYDALGRRIQKRTTTDTVNYYYDGDRIIEERASNNTVSATYGYGGEWIDASAAVAPRAARTRLGA